MRHIFTAWPLIWTSSFRKRTASNESCTLTDSFEKYMRLFLSQDGAMRPSAPKHLPTFE
jgi:hypothetical protein